MQLYNLANVLFGKFLKKSRFYTKALNVYFVNKVMLSQTYKSGTAFYAFYHTMSNKAKPETTEQDML